MAQKENFPGEGMIRSQKPSVVAAVGAVIAFLFFMLIGSGWILSLLLGIAAYFLINWLLGRSASGDAGAKANETHAPFASSSAPSAAAKKDADDSNAGAAPGAAAGFADMSVGAADDSAPAAEAVEVVDEVVVELSQPLRLEAPRDGKFLEILGTYDPLKDPVAVTLQTDRIQYWMGQGAIPTDTVRSILKKESASSGAE